MADLPVPTPVSPIPVVADIEPKPAVTDDFMPPPVMDGITPKSPYPLLVCFGDSITERGNCNYGPDNSNGRGTGWILALNHHYSARVDVLQRGFSGYNTRCAKLALPKAMAGLAENATAVIVWFGANDSVIHGRGGQHVPVDEYAENLTYIATEIKKIRETSPIIPVLVTPPPLQQEVADQGADGKDAGRRLNENTAKYAEACKGVAEKVGAPCIDMYHLMSKQAKDQEGLKKFVCDGLHLSHFGNEWVGRTVASELSYKVPGLEEPKWFPGWGQIDMKNPEKNFS